MNQKENHKHSYCQLSWKLTKEDNPDVAALKLTAAAEYDGRWFVYNKDRVTLGVVSACCSWNAREQWVETATEAGL